MTLAQLAVMCRETGGPGWGAAYDNLKRACELLIRYSTESQPRFAAEVDALIGGMGVFASPDELPAPIPVAGYPLLEWNYEFSADHPVLIGRRTTTADIVAEVIAGLTWDQIGAKVAVGHEEIRQCLRFATERH